MQAKLQQLMVSGMWQPTLDATCGVLFEAYAHDRLSNGGEFELRDLYNEAVTSETWSKREMIFSDADLSLALSTGKYWRPISPNWPTIDSAVSDSLIQITKASRHGIKLSGLKKMSDALEGESLRCCSFSSRTHFFNLPSYSSQMRQWE